MFSKPTSFLAIFTVFYISFFVAYFLWREYSIAKKMFSSSAARKCLQKKLLPFSIIGILIVNVSLLGYFYLPEELHLIWIMILYNLFACSSFLTMLIDFMSSKHSSERKILVYINKKEKEQNFSLFIIYVFSSTTLILFALHEYLPIHISSISIAKINGISFFSIYLCLGINGLILSFNSLKLVEEGIIYKFRLIKWNDIRAYKNISGLLDWDKSPFKIILQVRPNIWHMLSFIQISIDSQNIDSIVQILAERLPGKSI